MRSGTLPLPLIAGFGEAARLATEELEADLTRAWAYREQILALPHIHLNGHREQRVPSNLNLILPLLQLVSLAPTSNYTFTVIKQFSNLTGSLHHCM